MFRSCPVSLLLVALFLWVTACTTWKQIQVGEIAEQDRVRVTTADGDVTDFYDPAVSNDSISGRVRSDSQVRESIALDQAAQLRVGGVQPVLTVLTIVGATVLITYGLFEIQN